MLIAAVLLPMALGAILPLFRFRREGARSLYIMLSVLATSALMLPLVFTGAPGRETLFQITETLPIAFKLDGAGRVFAGIVSMLWPLATLYGLEYMQKDARKYTFFAFYIITYGVTLGIACASNLITLYLFYELLTLITLPLIMHGGSTRNIRAGLKYLYYSIGGAALVFIGLVYVIYYGGSTEFVYGGLGAMTMGATAGSLRIGYMICFLGFGVKAAIFPLHTWLIEAAVAPTPVTALLHAVAVVKSGVFAIIRATWFIFGPALLRGTYAQHIPLALASITIVYGCTMALKEQNIKRSLAYSTVSNLSYCILGALLLTEGGLRSSLMHMVYHAVIKITLFLCAGMYLKKGIVYSQDMRGVHRATPEVSAIYLLGALSLTGLPPLLGFLSKWMLATSAIQQGSRLALVGVAALTISAVLTFFYLVLPGLTTYMGKPERAYAYRELSPGWKALAPLAVLSVIILVLSFWSAPIGSFFAYAAAGGL